MYHHEQLKFRKEFDQGSIYLDKKENPGINIPGFKLNLTKPNL